MANCITEECDNPIKPGSKLLHCETCRHGLYYWTRKSVADVVERQRRLKMLNSRLNAITAKNDLNTEYKKIMSKQRKPKAKGRK